jgi:hypothetical protein
MDFVLGGTRLKMGADFATMGAPGHPVHSWSYDNNLKTYDTSTCLGQQGFAALRDASRLKTRMGQPS